MWRVKKARIATGATTATTHYDHVAGIAAASADTGVPVIFGVLTTESIAQALERAGTKAGNKGYEYAVSAIEMATLLRAIREMTTRGE